MPTVMQVLLRGRRILLVATLVAVAAGVVYSFTAERRYRSQAEMVVVQPQGNRTLAGFNSIAGALGISLGEGFSSLDLYSQYLRSRDLLRQLVREPVTLQDESSTTVLDRWGGSVDDGESLREERAIRKFLGHLQVSTSESAGTLQITVELFDPVAARTLADVFVSHLNAFDVEMKRWSAGNRSEFLGARREEVLRDLRAAEDSLTAFRMSNRMITHPRLQQQEMRLAREVTIQTELLQTIRIQEELAAIEAKGEAPVLKTIQHATMPVGPSWPRPARIVAVLVFVTWLIVGYSLVVIDAWPRLVSGDGPPR